jgi:flagellar assembly protein FliH
LSKVIKASEIKGKYEIKNHQNAFSAEIDVEKNFKDKNKKNSTEAENTKCHSNSYQNSIKAKKEAEAIIETAEAEADQIIVKAEQQKMKLQKEREKIYQNIKEEAYKEARQEVQTELNEISENFYKTLDKLEEQINKEKLKIKKDLVNLAVKIAAVIIDTKIELEPEIINKILGPIFKNINESHKFVTVKVNPHLIPHLDLDKIDSRFEKIDIEFSGDEDLKAGDCIVRSNLGVKEADLDHKLQLIKKELIREVVQNAEY